MEVFKKCGVVEMMLDFHVIGRSNGRAFEHTIPAGTRGIIDEVFVDDAGKVGNLLVWFEKGLGQTTPHYVRPHHIQPV